MSELVFMFPGQGSQARGMLDAFRQHAAVRETLEQASDVLGYDMAALIGEDADGRLDLTEYTQPALLTASVAMLRLWRALGGGQPAQVLGHSLGEYSALVAAQVIDFATGVELVAFRGRAMRDAVPQGVGRMAAILGLDDARVASLCDDCSDDDARVWAANYNCPGQVVVAGHAAAVERLIEAAGKAGARRAVPLAVSAPSHTPLMQPAAEAMRTRLADVALREPACPVWSNADARPLRHADEIRDALVRQLVSPVRWTDSIRALTDAHATVMVEMGPGKVLTGLLRRIARGVKGYNLGDTEQIKAAIAATGGEQHG